MYHIQWYFHHSLCDKERLLLEKIAIIGSGISGIAASYFLHEKYDVTLFESNAYFGGHSHTVEIFLEGKTVPVDTGFIVFNKRTYPNLVEFFKQLDIDIAPSAMSFAVSAENGGFEYCGASLSKFFVQRKHLISPKFWKFGLEILKFNKYCMEQDLGCLSHLSLEEFLDNLGVSEDFKTYYLYAMAGAIWSTPLNQVLQYPAKTLLTFFKNHGLLTLLDQPQWYTVRNGSRVYVEKALQASGVKKSLNCAVKSVVRQENQVIIKTEDSEATFNKVLFATPADITLRLLEMPTAQERDVLQNFRYTKNQAYLHTDHTLMPKRRNAWASWNSVLSEQNESSLSYWMNSLQPLETDTDVFVTLNPDKTPRDELCYQKLTYYHPLFDQKAINAQSRIQSLQGINNTWFCGSYQRYGFHEDGIWSALRVVNDLGVRAKWQ